MSFPTSARREPPPRRRLAVLPVIGLVLALVAGVLAGTAPPAAAAPAPTSITITIDPPTSYVGELRLVTVTVSSSSGTPTGEVSICQSSTSGPLCGLSRLEAGGVAEVHSYPFTTGTTDFTASYAGNDTFGPSEAGPVTSTVIESPGAPTAITLTAAPTTVTAGEEVALQATVTTEEGTPTGSVAFYRDTTLITTQDLVAGVADASWSPPEGGTFALVATYVPDGELQPSTSEAVTLTVEEPPPAATTTVLTAPTTAETGDPVALSAVVSADGATPTGSVGFYRDDTLIETVDLVDGAAAATFTPVHAGTYVLTATYVPSSGFVASTSDTVSLVVTGESTLDGLPVTGDWSVDGNEAELPEDSVFQGTYDAATGDLDGTFVFPEASLTLTIDGIGPVTARYQLAQNGPTQGRLSSDGTAVFPSTSLSFRIIEARVGAEALPLGDDCTYTPLILGMDGTADAEAVSVADPQFTIPPLPDAACDGLAGAINGFVAGDDNTFSVRIAGELALPGGPAVADYVDAIYQSLVGRPADPAGRAFWVAQLRGGLSPTSFTRQLLQSEEGRGRQVDSAYLGVLGRPADPAGRAHWVQHLAQRGTATFTFLRSLYASPEYHARAGGTDAEFVEALYLSGLILYRAPSEADVAYWAGVAASRGRSAVVTAIMRSSESVAHVVRSTFASTLERSPEPAALAFWSGWYRDNGHNPFLLAAHLFGTLELAARYGAPFSA